MVNEKFARKKKSSLNLPWFSDLAVTWSLTPCFHLAINGFLIFGLLTSFPSSDSTCEPLLLKPTFLVRFERVAAGAFESRRRRRPNNPDDVSEPKSSDFFKKRKN